MVKISRALLKNAAAGISKELAEILVCPISKQPLRHCVETGTLISDAIGVSFPNDTENGPTWILRLPILEEKYDNLARLLRDSIVDGIPCLVPHDGKILDPDAEEVTSEAHGSADSSSMVKKY